VPLVDYGAYRDGWFEAHASLPPLRVSGADARAAALHLVRFLRAADIGLTSEGAARHVRPALDGAPAGWRPLGVFLCWRPALDAIRTVLEAAGPPGVTAITVHGPHGVGLRTARLQMARAARLAGFTVVDSRFGAMESVVAPRRHLCVFDWLTAAPALPPLLSVAAAAGAARLAWIRFCRPPSGGASAIALEPLTAREMTNMIYIDEETGPSRADVRSAVAKANGIPGNLIRTLSATRPARGAAWVHETAPDYVVAPRAAAVTEPRTLRGGGIARLERGVEAARAIAARGRHARAERLLRRCADGLAARGASVAAASASCALGDLHFARGRPEAAAAAFEQAHRWSTDPAIALRALTGVGRARLELGRLADAEAALRTALLSTVSSPDTAVARACLAQTLYLSGRSEAAEEMASPDVPALLSTIRRQRGDLAAAAQAATEALGNRFAADPAVSCEGHLAAARVEAALGRTEEARAHTRAAVAAARRTRMPWRALCAAAEASACLEPCGVAIAATRRNRLLRAAGRLPPLAAARVRAALAKPGEHDEDLMRFVQVSGAVALTAAPRNSSDLIDRFQALIDTIHDTPDEAAALQAVAENIQKAIDACSVVIRSGRLARQVAVAGRAWPGEGAFTQAVIDGGCAVARGGVTPEAAEPIRAAGATIGSVAVRWVSGAAPPSVRATDLLRVAAAASAPLLRALAATVATATASTHVQYPDDLLGSGAAADLVRESIRRAAAAPYPVLIEGESGSGKELVARAIHARSPRRGRRFCAVNCAALTEELLEAELFGHARGAYTGAVVERHGLFEEADQGTLFLDEVAELSARGQAKLLRVLQEGEVRRVGENMPRKVDARIVAATNRSLEDDVRGGRFRADLRFRLDVIRIAIPPLRERPDEVPGLVERIWADAAARVGTRATLGEDVVAALARYDWPGNVRELQNVIAALAVHAPRRGRVPSSILPAHIAGTAAREISGFDEARVEFERRFVRAALARAGGRRAAAAAQLGVSRQGLAKIIKRLGI